MTTTRQPLPTLDQAPPHRLDAGGVLCLLRSAVGVGSWASPALVSRAFALGSLNDDPRAAVLTRLFGVRELFLARGMRHPNADVRRAVVRAGVAVDVIDVAASIIAVRKGAPKAILLTFAGGAAFFAALGTAAARQAPSWPER